MISLFSRAMEYHVDAQFRRDPSGRLAFLPFGPRKKAYFVDSKSDEEKIRSFLKMYRTASALLNVLVFPSVYLPGFVLNFYRGPVRSKVETIAWVALFFILLFGALAWTLWSVYKETIPGFTSSLNEVGPDLQSQLREGSPRPRQLQKIGLVFLLAGAVLLVAVAVAALYHFRW